MITPDKIFSYWIIVWYLLFVYKFIDINPKFILIIGLLENIILLILLIKYSDIVNILYFLIVILTFKIIPILTLWNYKIYNQDIYYTFFIFGSYLTWLYITNSMYNPYTTWVNAAKYNKPNTPGMILLHSLFDKYLY
jgi:hypothetical protein